MSQEFREQLKKKMDEYVKLVYHVTKSYPRDELYGVISQLRRSALSVVLNYIEGYARRRIPTCYHFWEMAYGSLQESRYLLELSLNENYLSTEDHKVLSGLADEISAMLWQSLKNLEKYK
ncbi:MAG: four helix bundle protein [Patescibacteria group bacterium]